MPLHECSLMLHVPHLLTCTQSREPPYFPVSVRTGITALSHSLNKTVELTLAGKAQLHMNESLDIPSYFKTAVGTQIWIQIQAM